MSAYRSGLPKFGISELLSGSIVIALLAFAVLAPRHPAIDFATYRANPGSHASP